MIRTGGCHCGAIRYQAEGEPLHHAVCHCSDCRASSGAPMLAWYAIKQDQLQLISGEPVTFEGTPGAQRQFCGTCGTGLFYRNAEMLPGIVDIQSATFDDAASVPPGAQIQCAERLEWVSGLENLPAFDRYPGA
ncbi:GFA family protein [Croceibacterium xixiisoli]|uniref:GFA family protein n=1 Tax=Croceibacterium xixiisoli TaxID=1476466 RepID=UPI001927BCC7|nr:GFA family protein [Croceibacterium xixiisoli]